MFPNFTSLKLTSDQIEEIKKRLQDGALNRSILMVDDSGDLDPANIQRQIELNFLTCILALQENMISMVMNDQLQVREGFFNNGLFPDEVINSNLKNIQAIKDLCIAYESFSNGYDFIGEDE